MDDGKETGDEARNPLTKTVARGDGGGNRVDYGLLVLLRAFVLSILNMISAGLHAVRRLPQTFSKVVVEKGFHAKSIRSSCDGLKSARPFSCSAARLDPQRLREQWGSPSFDVAQMTHLLDHDNHEKRAKFRKILTEDPLMTPKYNISIDEERDLALKRLKTLCDQGFISVLDFKNNPLWIFAAHELAAMVDAAMATKMTVQFNLFGGTVLKLGTERHHNKLLTVSLPFIEVSKTIRQNIAILDFYCTQQFSSPSISISFSFEVKPVG